MRGGCYSTRLMLMFNYHMGRMFGCHTPTLYRCSHTFTNAVYHSVLVGFEYELKEKPIMLLLQDRF